MYNSEQLETLFDNMAKDVEGLIADTDPQQVEIIGIQTGGVWVAQAINQRLARDTSPHTLNISFYRDDFTRIGLNPKVNPSSLPATLQDKTIVLVDDVLYTGRTVRAALNELFDYGRPKRVILVVLADRGGRELPFAADVVGTTLSLAPNQQIKLQGPSPLSLTSIAS